MTLSVRLPWSRLRRPSRYGALLLPFLPILKFWVNPDRPGGSLQVPFIACLFLLALLLTLAEILWRDRTDDLTRKEIDLLRPAWLTSLYATQVPLMLGPETFPLALVYFGASCALISSLTFGIEFQQRTLSGLLSQPIARSTMWNRKMGVLAAALLSLLIVFIVAAFAFGLPIPPGLVVMLLLTAGLAWSTTPFWTLMVRGLLPGLVFSLAAILAAAAVLVLAWDALERLVATSLTLQMEATPETLVLALTYVVAPFYLVTAAWLGRRHWLRLEAMDLPAGDAGGIFLGAFRWARPERGTGRSPVWRLVAKELRIQTVTIAACLITLGLACGVPFSHENSLAHTYLILSVVLMGFVTVLLAAATSIAEERRLGTAESQAILPMSSWVQGCVKFAVAMALFLPAAGAIAMTMGGLELKDVFQGGGLLLLLPALFSATILTSSSAVNTLRALLLGILLTSVAVGLGILTLEIGEKVLSAAGQLLEGQFSDESQVWIDRAQQLGSQRLEALEASTMAPQNGQMALYVLTPVLIPCALALWFAFSNFRRPAERAQRVMLQSLTCLVVLLLSGLADLYVIRQVLMSRQVSLYIVEAGEFLRWRDGLSRAERMLLDESSLNSIRGNRLAVVRFAVEDTFPTNRTVEPVRFPLPLSPVHRAQLMQHGDLPGTVREALLEDAIRKGDNVQELPPEPIPVPAPPSSPSGVYRLSPELMRRYGLTGVMPGPGIENPVEPAAPAPTLQLDPQLMLRYGITNATGTKNGVKSE